MCNKLHIVYATDDKYLLPTFVALASAAHHASRANDLIIDILDVGINDDYWDELYSSLVSRLPRGVSIVRHRVDLKIFHNASLWHGSKGTYARLLLPAILVDQAWCVYCDGDTLFLSDPFALENVFDSNYAIQGHLDCYVKQPAWYSAHALQWDPSSYVCAGFLLMNLDWMRKNDTTDKCIRFIADYPDALFPDQDALNVVCKNFVGTLPEEWGVFSYAALRLSSIGCIHYVGERPWQLPYIHGVPLPDTSRVWFNYAKRLCGFGFSDFGVSSIRYIRLYLMTRLLGLVYNLFSSLSERFSRKYSIARSRYMKKAHYKLFLLG